MNDEKPDDISKQQQQQAKIHIIKAITRIAAANAAPEIQLLQTKMSMARSQSPVGFGSARFGQPESQWRMKMSIHSSKCQLASSCFHFNDHPLSQIEPSPGSSPCQTDRPIFPIAAN